jgi:hypothetical protein
MTQTATQQQTDIDWGLADGTNQDYIDVYPRIQWHHGLKQMSKVGGIVFTGGLFVPQDQFPNFAAEGWTEDAFIASSGEEIKGYASQKASLAVIRVKSWWPKDDAGGSLGSRTHFLCCIKGVEGIFSLQVGGVSKGQPMTQAFTDHRNQIVAMVNRSKPQGANNFEPYALWFVVEPGPHDKQVSKGDSSKSSDVTRPRLSVPAEINLEYARTLWVGAENYQLFSQIYKDTEPWQSQFPKQGHAEDAEMPTHSGGDRATAQQIEHITGLCAAKGLDEKQLTMDVTNGATDNLAALTQDEARTIIDTAKSM